MGYESCSHFRFRSLSTTAARPSVCTAPGHSPDHSSSRFGCDKCQAAGNRDERLAAEEHDMTRLLENQQTLTMYAELQYQSSTPTSTQAWSSESPPPHDPELIDSQYHTVLPRHSEAIQSYHALESDTNPKPHLRYTRRTLWCYPRSPRRFSTWSPQRSRP
jgi:hypothetical protein